MQATYAPTEIEPGRYNFLVALKAGYLYHQPIGEKQKVDVVAK